MPFTVRMSTGRTAFSTTFPSPMRRGWENRPAGQEAEGQRKAAARFVRSAGRQRGRKDRRSERNRRVDLFIDGIGPDKISDITTNVIRGLLIEYTQAQCELHSIPTTEVPAGSMWDMDLDSWTSQYAKLPVWHSARIMLVPKASVRFRMSLDSHEYYNHFILHFLQAEHIRAGSSLVKVFKKSQQPYVTKKSLKKLHPFSKDEL